MKYFKLILLLVTSCFVLANLAMAGEDKLLLNNDGYLGGFSKSDRKKETGTVTLEIYKPFHDNLKKNGFPDINKTKKLTIGYDEIWERKKTEYLSKEEIRLYFNDLDIIIVYMKNDKIQACVAKKKFKLNPLTGAYFKKPEYKIVTLESRSDLMKRY